MRGAAAVAEFEAKRRAIVSAMTAQEADNKAQLRKGAARLSDRQAAFEKYMTEQTMKEVRRNWQREAVHKIQTAYQSQFAT